MSNCSITGGKFCQLSPAHVPHVALHKWPRFRQLQAALYPDLQLLNKMFSLAIPFFISPFTISWTNIIVSQSYFRTRNDSFTALFLVVALMKDS